MRGKFRTVDGVREKQCPRCEEWKPRDAAHYHVKSTSKFSGITLLQSACKPCMLLVTNAWRADPEVRERQRWKVREYSREYRRKLRADPIAHRAAKDKHNARAAELRQLERERIEATVAHGRMVVEMMSNTKKHGKSKAAVLALDLLTRGWANTRKAA